MVWGWRLENTGSIKFLSLEERTCPSKQNISQLVTSARCGKFPRPENQALFLPHHSFQNEKNIKQNSKDLLSSFFFPQTSIETIGIEAEHFQNTFLEISVWI